MGERIVFGIYQSCRNRGVWDVCLCLGCSGVHGVVSRYLYIVLDAYLCILGAPSVLCCCSLSVSAS